MTKKSGSQCVVDGKTHYERFKVSYTERTRLRKKQIRGFIRSLKNKPCHDCQQSYPYYVMDFDHKEPNKKIINPSQICTLGWGEEKILEELGKCDLVCANCHRIRTHKRQKEFLV